MRRPKFRSLVHARARLTRYVASRHEWDKAAKWDWWDPTITGFLFLFLWSFSAFAVLAFRVDALLGPHVRRPFDTLCVFLALLVVPQAAAHVSIGLRRRRRDMIGARIRGRRCARCGYDRTGNVSGVCPECGTPLRPGTKWPTRWRSGL